MSLASAPRIPSGASRLPFFLFPLLAGFVVMAAGCAGPPVKGPEKPLPSAAQAIEEIRTRAGGRRSVRAQARVTYFGKEGRVRLRAVLAAERPGSFRVETLTPFEQPIDVMASDGDRLWLLSGQRLRAGPASPENVARLIPIALSPAEVVDTLLGGVPSTERFSPLSLEPAPNGRWRIALSRPDGERVELEVDPVRRVVLGMVLFDAGGGIRAKVEFGDFERLAGGGEFSREIAVIMPDRDLDVRIKLKEVEVDVPLDRGLFRLEPPPGIAVEPLDGVPP